MSSSGEKRLIALRFPPGPPLADALARAWEADEAVLPLDPGLPQVALAALLDVARPHALRDPAGESSLDHPAPIGSSAAAVVTTSGTTGAPKAVELSHAALEAAAGAALRRLGATDDDRWLCCVPLWRIAGLGIVVRARLAGVAPVIHEGFDPAAIGRETGVSLVSVVPTMLYRLLEAGVDVARFRRILVGGGPIDPALLDRARAAGANVVRTYGMTETCGGVVYDGLPLEGVELAFEADGGVCIGGPTLMSGYRGDAARTRAVLHGGFLRTMDIGRMDGGRLVIERRRDDVVVTGGEKVSLREAGELLLSHPQVRRASVMGEADAEWGRRLVAYVEPVDAANAPTLEDLRRWVAERAPRYAAPRELVIVRGPG